MNTEVIVSEEITNTQRIQGIRERIRELASAQVQSRRDRNNTKYRYRTDPEFRAVESVSPYTIKPEGARWEEFWPSKYAKTLWLIDGPRHTRSHEIRVLHAAYAFLRGQRFRECEPKSNPAELGLIAYNAHNAHFLKPLADLAGCSTDKMAAWLTAEDPQP